MRAGSLLFVAALASLGVSGGSARVGDRAVAHSVVLGSSVRGREIRVLERGDPDGTHRILVVGSIHGDEPAGIAIAERLETMPIPPEADVWIIESANPDGTAARTRTNANGVDLNRNFPWHWRQSGRPGDRHYPGPRALSEPESRLLAQFIRRLKPQTAIWFHQPYGVVDQSGGDVAVERRFAALTGLPLQRLPRYPGGVTDWQNANFPGTTAFVTELGPGSLTSQRIDRFARAVLALAGGS
jgi:murein peptide amidase A